MNFPVAPGGALLCMGCAGNASWRRNVTLQTGPGVGNRLRFQGAATTPPTVSKKTDNEPHLPTALLRTEKDNLFSLLMLKAVWRRQSTKETDRFIPRNLLIEEWAAGREVQDAGGHVYSYG